MDKEQLIEDANNAITETEILESQNALLRAKHGYPPGPAPTMAELGDGLAYSKSVFEKASEHLPLLTGTNGSRWIVTEKVQPQDKPEKDLKIIREIEVSIPTVDMEITITATDQKDEISVNEIVLNGGLKWIHKQWKSVNKERRNKKLSSITHPFAPIILAWIQRPKSTNPHIPKQKVNVPSLENMTQNEVSNLCLMDLPQNEQKPTQQLLPGFDGLNSRIPSWILWLYNQATGGRNLGRGKGAPWDLHIFVSAIMQLSISDRTGQWFTCKYPHFIEHEDDWPDNRMSVERWLFKDGWDPKNKKRYWYKLPEALNSIRNLGYVPIGDYRVQIITPSVIPESMDARFIEFTIRIPRSASQGARVDFDRLREYRTTGHLTYKAYLTAMALINRSAKNGNGITAEIGKPILDKDGNELYKKNKLIRSKTEFIENPLKQYVPNLSDKDLAISIGLDPDNRNDRYKARKTFEYINEKGDIDMRNDGTGIRIFSPEIARGSNETLKG